MAVVLPENQLVPPVEIGERKLVVGGQYLVHRQGVPSRQSLAFATSESSR
jgi:hypothetical protein